MVLFLQCMVLPFHASSIDSLVYVPPPTGFSKAVIGIAAGCMLCFSIACSIGQLDCRLWMRQNAPTQLMKADAMVVIMLAAAHKQAAS